MWNPTQPHQRKTAPATASWGAVSLRPGPRALHPVGDPRRSMALRTPWETGLGSGAPFSYQSGVQHSGRPHCHENMTLDPLVPFQNSPDSPLDKSTVALNENVCDKAFQERIGAVKVC